MTRSPLLFSLLLICACARICPEIEITRAGIVSYSASIEPQTRTSMDGSYGVHWEMSDEVSLFPSAGGEGVGFSISKLENDGTTATFTGPNGEYACALYPASASAAYNPASGIVRSSVPSVQTGVEGSFAQGANLALAQITQNSGQLFFRNAGALLSLLVPGNYITRIRIESRDASVAMTGGADVVFNEGVPAISSTSTSRNYVELTMPEQSAGKRYYAVVFPGNYSQGFTVTFYTSSGAFNRYTSTKGVELSRNSIMRLIEKNWTVVDDRPSKSQSGTELIAPEIISGGDGGNGTATMRFSCGSGKRDTYKLYRRNADTMGIGTLVETMYTGSGQYGSFSYTFTGLQSGACYDLGVSASCTGQSGYDDSPIVWLDDITVTGEPQPELYDWESSRNGVPSFADISLVTLGRHSANPPAWSKQRFASHVTYTDELSVPHWLFDAFLCIDTYDSKRSRSYCITSSSLSANKASWEDLLEDWLGNDGALRKLDSAVSDAAATLGVPPKPRYIVMGLPDPIMFENFADKSSSTTYWGDIEGRPVDFSDVEDQKAAYKWYMDRCRERFNALGFNYLELAGFYVLSEELHLPASYYDALGVYYFSNETWNAQYKRWEQLVPYAAEYAHSHNEGLWWIPYLYAPGHTVWNYLGFDRAFMQPNRYWDHDEIEHPLSSTISTLQSHNMGIELEFEYSAVASVMADGRGAPDGNGNLVFYSADVPMLQDRVREYMDAYKQSGLYGVLPFAVYSGTDAMHQLASSADESDRQLYHDICHFIIESTLKQ